MTGYTFNELTTDKPFKALTRWKKAQAWRWMWGRISVRHQWGRHKRKYRYMDFYFHDKKDIPAKIETIEYDPFRTAYISLVCYADWERRYVIAHKDMKVWDTIITAENPRIVPGNRAKISNIPVWTEIYNIEVMIKEGAKYARSAGSYGTVVSHEWKYTQVKFPSWEVRYVNKECYASIWIVSNVDHSLIVIGKAGRQRWKWIRPTVLGKSMNPCDHPHGWGEWHQPIGMKYPKTPWWRPALGVKTRRRKSTNKWIAKRRK